MQPKAAPFSNDLSLDGREIWLPCRAHDRPDLERLRVGPADRARDLAAVLDELGRGVQLLAEEHLHD